MHKRFLMMTLLSALLSACDQGPPISPEHQQKEAELSEAAAKDWNTAWEQAQRNQSAGLHKLFEIADDCDTYTVEYCEIAYDDLSLLLYTKTALWVKTFAAMDQARFRKRFVDIRYETINPAILPKDVTSEVQFYEGIMARLKKVKGDKKEVELAQYLLGIASRNMEQSRE